MKYVHQVVHWSDQSFLESYVINDVIKDEQNTEEEWEKRGRIIFDSRIRNSVWVSRVGKKRKKKPYLIFCVWIEDEFSEKAWADRAPDVKLIFAQSPNDLKRR